MIKFAKTKPQAVVPTKRKEDAGYDLFSDSEFYLIDLKSKFNKINPKEYYLSYSGGKDSHFLYWFLRVWLFENDIDMYIKYRDIEIVGCNTYMEHPQILKRIYDNSDRVLLPAMKPFEIKEKYGIPCFSKEQDQFIYSYQKAISENREIPRTTKEKVYGTYHTGFNISKKARGYILSGQAHKITHHCCTKLKKEPFHKYEKETGRKPILGIRSGESALRKRMYRTCFTSNGKFTPIHDLKDETLEAIIELYNIEVPEIYDHISRTGCMGCPYGSWKKETQKELKLIDNPNQLKFISEYFKESYEVLGVDVEKIKED